MITPLVPPPEDPRSKSQDNGQDRLFAVGDSEEVVLRQSRFWARSITWTLMGVTGFALAWLALAKTEEIVTAPGKLEPLGVVRAMLSLIVPENSRGSWGTMPICRRRE